MAVLDLPPIEGVPDELITLLNRRFRDVPDASGVSAVTQSRGTIWPDQRPTLTPKNAGYRFYDTLFGHWYQWTGQIWELDRGDMPGRIEMFDANPGTGWQLCDGTASVRRTKKDATGTEVITVPTWNVGCYPRFAAAWGAGVVNAAVVPTTGAPSATANMTAGGVAVASGAHTHAVALPGDPVANTDVLPYMRL